MRISLAIDDELMAAAREFSGLRKKSAIIHAALKALIEGEAARRMARLGGSAPNLLGPRRRRPKRTFPSQ